ncbi:MAG: TIGR02996 domain-containing protein [Kofleriaceae bacterium]
MSTKRAAAEAWEAIERKGDPLDAVRLGAACGCGSRDDVGRHVAALAERDDPSLAAALLALLADPPYWGATSRQLTQQILYALEATRDRRAAEPARDLGARYLSVRPGKSNAQTSTKITKIANELVGCAFVELTRSEREACESLEARFGVALFPPPEIAARKRTLAELLAEVYAAPDDDGPREIYADALNERGDPRGEWIILELAEARGALDRTGRRRKAELELENFMVRDTWAHPLSNAADVSFERGFPAVLNLHRNAKQLVGVPELATIKVVNGIDKIPPKTALALLETPAAQHVREIKTFTGPLLDHAATTPRPWTRIKIGGTEVPKPRSFANLPQLTNLTIETFGDKIPADLVASVVSLRRLSIKSMFTPLAELVVPPQLVELSLDQCRPQMLLAVPPSVDQLELCDVLPRLSLARIPRVVGLYRITASPPNLAQFAGVREFTATLGRAESSALVALARELTALVLGFSSVHPQTFASLRALTSLHLIGPIKQPLVLDGIPLEKLCLFDSKPWELPAIPTLRKLELCWLPDLPALLALYPALEHVSIFAESGALKDAELATWRAALDASAIATFELGGARRLNLERDADGAFVTTT